MERILLCAILVATSPSNAQAEEAGDASTPLVFDVRPSRFEESPDARQERLMRRSRDLDFAFRSICNGCGTASAYSPQTGTAFSPLNALTARPKRQDRPEREPEQGDGVR